MAVKDNLRKGHGGNISINGLIQQYKVSSSGEISAGDFVKFVNDIQPDKEFATVNKVKNGEVEVYGNGAYYGEYEINKTIFDTTTNINTTDEIKAVALDSQRALIVYRDSDNSSAGTAIIATIKNGKVTYGTTYVFNTNQVSDIGLAVPDKDKVLVFYSDKGNENKGTVTVLYTSADRIKIGNSMIFNDSTTLLNKAVTVDTNKVLLMFKDNINNGAGTAMIITIDGDNNIGTTTKTVFNNISLNYLDASLLEPNKVIVTHSGSATYSGSVNIITINDKSISIGPIYSLDTDIAGDKQDRKYLSVTAINEKTIVIVYNYTMVINSIEYSYCTAVSGTVNANAITFGTREILCTNMYTTNISINTMADNTGMIVYQAYSDGYYYLYSSIVKAYNNKLNTSLASTVKRTLSTYPASTLCSVRLDDYNCLTLVKTTVDSSSNFECYSMMIPKTTEYNVYNNGAVENTGSDYYKSISGDFGCIDAIAIDDNTALISYVHQKEWNGNDLVSSEGVCYMVYTTDSTKPISQWNETSVVFESGSVDCIDTILINENKALLVYQDKANSNQGVCRLLTINKNSDDIPILTVGTKSAFCTNSIHMDNSSLIRLDDTRGLIVYRNESDYGIKARVITIGKDNVLTFGTECVLGAGTADSYGINMSAATVDLNKVYVVYTMGEETSTVTGKLLEIKNDNTIKVTNRDFEVEYAVGIYENKLTSIEPNVVMYSNSTMININGGSAVSLSDTDTVNKDRNPTTYDITTDTVNTTNLIVGDIINCPYSGEAKEIELPPGSYKLECWGAQGGDCDSSEKGGKGGYSNGIINLYNPAKLYLYSGGSGKASTGHISSSGGFNGGGIAQGQGDTNGSYPAGGGGGGTDIRIGSDSLYSRVIVAGGGGGGIHSYYGDRENGSYGGGITGGNGRIYSGVLTSGGTQTSGGSGYNGNYGRFGYGSSGYSNSTLISISGGGGGWYGGGAGTNCGAAGGSGYVYNEANSVNYPEGCLLNSSYYLSDAETISGDQSFTDPETGSSTTGRSGDGYIRITMLKVLIPPKSNKSKLLTFKGTNLIVDDTASIAPANTTNVSNTSVLKIGRDFQRTLLLATFNHMAEDTEYSNPYIIPGNMSLNYDQEGQYQFAYTTLNNVFSHADTYDTVAHNSVLLGKDRVLSARTNRLVTDTKVGHTSTLELQTFDIQNLGGDPLEKFDITDNTSQSVILDGTVLSTTGVKIDDNRVLLLASILKDSIYSGVCKVVTIDDIRQGITINETAQSFSSVRTENIKAVLVDNNKVLITFNTRTDTTPGNSYAVAVTVYSNNTISIGELMEFTEPEAYDLSPVLVDTNKVLILCGNVLRLLQIGSSDNSITELSGYVVESDANGVGAIDTGSYTPKTMTVLENGKIMLAYISNTLSYCATVNINTDNSISIGTRFSLTSSNIVQNSNNTINSILLDSNKILVEYIIDTNIIYTVVLTVNDNNTITVGSRAAVIDNIDPLQHLNLHRISSNKVLVPYIVSNNDKYGIKYNILTINGNTIIKEDTRTFKDTYTSVPFTDATILDNDAIVFYTKESDVTDVSCSILYNTVESIIDYTAGIVEYTDTVDAGALSPYSDYTMVSNNIIENTKVVKLSDNKVFIAYTDQSTKYGVAKIAEISGKLATYGSEYVFNNTDTSNISLQLLSNNRVLIAFTDNNVAKFTIGAINGTGIIFTNSVGRSGSHINGGSIGTASLSTDKVFIAYQDGTCELLTIEDNSIITFSNISIFDSNTLDNINVIAIDNSRALIIYKSTTSSSYDIKSTVATISGNIITFTDICTVYHSDTDFDGTTSVVKTDSGLLRYVVSINSQGIITLLNVNLDTYIITVNSSSNITFNSDSNIGKLIYIGDDKYVLLYSNGISGNGIILNVTGTTITPWLEYTFDNQKISNLDAIYLSNNKIFVALNEFISGYYTSLATLLYVNINGDSVYKYDGTGKPNGIAKTSGLANQTIDVYVPGNVQQ